MSQVKIRKIPVRHVNNLHRLFSDALITDFDYFSAGYRQQVLDSNNLLKMYLGTLNPSRLYIGLYYDNKLAGYSLSSIQLRNQNAHSKKGFLYWLFVHPDIRNKKLGKKLLMHTEQNLKKRGVDSISLVTHNQQKFYEHQNYVLDKILPGIVADVDMYMMNKRLV